MITRRTTRIRIDTQRILVVSRGDRPDVDWCESCGSQVNTITPSEAAIAANVDVRTVYRWIEAGRVHSVQTPEGFLLVCLNSRRTEDSPE